MPRNADGPKHGTRIFPVWGAVRDRSAEELNAELRQRKADRKMIAEALSTPTDGRLTEKEKKRRFAAVQRTRKIRSDH